MSQTKQTDLRSTLCWKCSKPYTMDCELCPHCNATNANFNEEKAYAEAEMLAAAPGEGTAAPKIDVSESASVDGTTRQPQGISEPSFNESSVAAAPSAGGIDSRRLDWLDAHCSFVADPEYKIGPFQVGELRQLADAGLAADWANKRAAPSAGEPVAWIEEELKDGDRICEALGLERTEGGRLPMHKILAAIRNARHAL